MSPNCLRIVYGVMPRRIILSVEDDSSTYHILTMAFEEAAPEIELHRALDGDQALSMLRGPNETERLRSDLIMLNLNLPKRTGFELLEEMRKDGLVESIPVVVFSSSSLNSDKARCLALGAKGYFTKPANFDEFVQTVQSLCGLLR